MGIYGEGYHQLVLSVEELKLLEVLLAEYILADESYRDWAMDVKQKSNYFDEDSVRRLHRKLKHPGDT